MSEFKSKLVAKIASLNIDRRFFSGSIHKGLDYLNQGRIKYIFSPKVDELIVLIEGTELYVVHLYLKNNVLSYDCTCPYQYDCKHDIASLLLVQRNILTYDNLACVEEPLKASMDRTYDVYYGSLMRLISEKYLVTFYTEGDFNFLFNKVCSLTKAQIKVNLEDAITKFNRIVTIASRVQYLKVTYNIKIERDIYPMFYDIISRTDERILSIIKNSINEQNINIIIECLKLYELNHAKTGITSELLNYIIDYIKHNNEEISDDVKVLLAKDYYVNNKYKFISFAKKNLEVDKIREMLISLYLVEDRFEDIYDIYKNIALVTPTDYETYIRTLKEIGFDYLDVAKEYVNKFSSLETYKFLKGFLTQDEIESLIKSYIETLTDYSKRIAALTNLGLRRSAINQYYEVKSKKLRLNIGHEYFNDFYSEDGKKFLLTYQEDIYETYAIDHNKPFNKYFDDILSINFGFVYVQALIQKMYEDDKMDYSEYGYYSMIYRGVRNNVRINQ